MRIKFIGSGSDENERFPSSILIDENILVNPVDGIEGKLGEDVKVKHYLKPGENKDEEEFKIGKYSVKPISAGSSKAFSINGYFVFSGDVDEEFFLSEKGKELREAISDAKLIIFDGSFIESNKQLGEVKVLNKLNELFSGRLYFIQISNFEGKFTDLRAKVREFNENWDVAHDLQEVAIGASNSLGEGKSRIKVPERIAEGIANENYDSLVDCKALNELENKTVDVTSGNKMYASVKVKAIEPMTVNEFRNREENHGVSDDYRKEHWSGKDVLYRYKFELIKIYKPPKDIPLANKEEESVENFEQNEGDYVDEIVNKFNDETVICDSVAIIADSVTDKGFEMFVSKDLVPEGLNFLNNLSERIFPDKEVTFVVGTEMSDETKFIPVFDLKFEKSEKRVVDFAELTSKVKLMRFTEPMKPVKEYYLLEELIDDIVGA